jgi:glycosyltransferase involved in cell wall biosynthesis
LTASILVSVIIPLHNSENYVTETINSCLKQTHQLIEVIIVENGSKDLSLAKAKAAKDSRVQIFDIGNASATKARNYGYKKSNGEFIMFLDADDVLAENKIEQQLTALQKKPEGWIASCAWGKFNSKLDEAKVVPQKVWKIEDPIDWCTTSWIGGGMMIPACWLIPKSIIEKAGLWDERLSLHDDGEFMCRVLLASKGQVFVENTMVYYRQVAGSLSRNNKSEKAAKSALGVFISYEKNILKHSNNQATRLAIAHNYRNFIYEFYPNHKDLIQKAENQLNGLGLESLPIVGGARFKQIAKLIGFKTALSVVGALRAQRK